MAQAPAEVHVQHLDVVQGIGVASEKETSHVQQVELNCMQQELSTLFLLHYCCMCGTTVVSELMLM